MTSNKVIWFILFCMVGLTSPIHAQSILDVRVKIPPREGDIDYVDIFNYWQVHYGLTISYNQNTLRPYIKSTTSLPNTAPIETYFKALFDEEKIQWVAISNNKIILAERILAPKIEEVYISGIVYGAHHERLYSAMITEENSGKTTLTNENGYFVMQIPKGKAIFKISYLGYKTYSCPMLIKQSATSSFTLEVDSDLPTVTIRGIWSRYFLKNGGDNIDIFNFNQNKTLLGEEDIIKKARLAPGVQSGGEGQSGMYVRGGTPDQNLILMDGMALYESSHLLGISSVFIDEMVSKASFSKNGFSAQYGGRLSSVLDVRLKEGSSDSISALFSMGIAGFKGVSSGPIGKGKTSYAVGLRYSWIDLYVENLVRRFTKYDDINIGYTDIVTKVSHKFTENNTLSISYYRGSDRLAINRFDKVQSAYSELSSDETHTLNWGNTLISAQWRHMLTKRLFMQGQIGGLQYDNGSRSSYAFLSKWLDKSESNELDILATSYIQDVQAKMDFDYYLNDRHTLRWGGSIVRHGFNPTVKQSTLILNGTYEDIRNKDSLINAQTWSIYAEDNIKFNKLLFLYLGLHGSGFKVEGKQYSYLQPRFKMLLTPSQRFAFSVNYSHMVQYIHLLSNPGLGLPTDLWVPSTPSIAPQTARQFSADFNYSWDNKHIFYFSLYRKTLFNQLEYLFPVELFYFLIDQDIIKTVLNNNRDWERNVVKGTGTSSGVEVLFKRQNQILSGWVSYAYTHTNRLFPDLNEGFPFPSNFDRTHDLNMGLDFSLSTNFSVGMQFVYGSGNTFSLATEEFNSFLGIKLLNASNRNNYRLPSFHQLSINATYVKKLKDYKLSFDFQIYNVYNRLNAYFIYIYRDSIGQAILRKVSILPFTPSLQVTLSF